MKFSIIYVNHHLLSTLATIIILDNSISITGIAWDLSRYEVTMIYNFRLAAVVDGVFLHPFYIYIISKSIPTDYMLICDPLVFLGPTTIFHDVFWFNLSRSRFLSDYNFS
ncbi:hypothetical protein ACJX0J_024072, partial [Zea mays]